MPSRRPATRQVFDAAYYRRFYRDAPVHDRRRVGHLAAGVLGLAAWWSVPVRSVLDIGAGPGFWRAWLAEHRPTVRYRSVDASAYACQRYGHEQRDISTWAPARPSDLVVCQGVLQYLDDDAAEAAMANLAAATRSLLYLEVPTTADLDAVLDHERTDLAVHFRSGDWYRQRLGEYFDELGCGLHHRHGGRGAFYELEQAQR